MMDDDDVIIEDLEDIAQRGVEPRELNELSENNRKEISVDILCNFLEVCFHQILFIRQLYPRGIFVKRKKYNVPVHMSCHPGLNIYLANILSSIKPLLLKNEIPQVVLSISKDDKFLEKFVFEINKLLPNQKKDKFLLQTELSLRSILLKILTCDTYLPNLPQDSTFEILIHAKGESGFDLMYSENEVNWTTTNDPKNKSTLYPLYSLNDSDFLNMQVFVLSNHEK